MAFHSIRLCDTSREFQCTVSALMEAETVAFGFLRERLFLNSGSN